MSSGADRSAGASRILTRLKGVRDAAAAESEQRRRELLTRALLEDLATLGDAQRDGMLGALREQLSHEARESAGEAGALKQELERLRQELAASRHHATEVSKLRDELQLRLSTAQSELEVVRQRAVAAPPPPPPVTPTSSSSGDALRDCLQRLAQGQEDSAAVARLDAADQQVYQLFREVMQFSLDLARSILEFKIRLMGGGSIAIKDIPRRMQALMVDSLAAKSEALVQLQKQLSEVKEFPLDIWRGYEAALPTGVQRLLEDLDPELIRSKHTGGFMKDNERVLREISAQFATISNLPPDEWRERYFDTPIREELTKRLR